MAVPQTESASGVVPTPVSAHDAKPTGSPCHPVIRLAWLLAGLAIAAGIGPWMSQHAGVMLPAFALIRTRGRSPAA